MWTFRPTFEREITDYAPPTFVNSLWPCIKRIMTILTCCGCVLVFGVQARSENMKIEVRCRKWKVWSLDLKMQTSIGISTCMQLCGLVAFCNLFLPFCCIKISLHQTSGFCISVLSQYSTWALAISCCDIFMNNKSV